MTAMTILLVGVSIVLSLFGIIAWRAVHHIR